MNSYLLYLLVTRGAKNGNSEGFTLIELMIVVIIIGILSAVSIPSFMAQVGKARDIEFSHSIGAVLRSQQAYHWEKTTFAQGADDEETLKLLGLTIDKQYIDTYNINASSTHATIAPVNNEFEQDGTRAFSAGIFFIAPNYRNIICRSPRIKDQIPPPPDPDDCLGNEVLR